MRHRRLAKQSWWGANAFWFLPSTGIGFLCLAAGILMPPQQLAAASLAASWLFFSLTILVILRGILRSALTSGMSSLIISCILASLLYLMFDHYKKPGVSIAQTASGGSNGTPTTAASALSIKMILQPPIEEDKADLTAVTGAILVLKNGSKSPLHDVSKIISLPSIKKVTAIPGSTALNIAGDSTGSTFIDLTIPELKPSAEVEVHVQFLHPQPYISSEKWARDYTYSNIDVARWFVGPEDGKSRAPDKANDHRQVTDRPMSVSVTFKDSPLFTDKTKRLIAVRMSNFYDYLARVGFLPPKDIVVETRPGGAYGSSVTFPGPFYMNYVSIPGEKLRDADAPVRAFAMYAFPLLFDADNANRKDMERRSLTARVYQGYFVSGFLNLKVEHGSGEVGRWVEALMEIRNAIGPDPSDRLCFFAFRAFNDFADMNPKVEFSDYLCNSIALAEFTLYGGDSLNHQSVEIQEVLRSHQLLPMAKK